MRLTIDFDDEDIPEALALLGKVVEQARSWGNNCRLRSQDPETRRYAYFGAGAAITKAIKNLETELAKQLDTEAVPEAKYIHDQDRDSRQG